MSMVHKDSGPSANPAWEPVTHAGHSYQPMVNRLRVEGGWIYQMTYSHREPCAVFVPETEAMVIKCSKCHVEPALEVHECPLRKTLCTCGVDCSHACRAEAASQ